MIFVDFGVPSLDMHPFKSKCWLEKNKIQEELTKMTTLVAQIMNPRFLHDKILSNTVFLPNHSQTKIDFLGFQKVKN